MILARTLPTLWLCGLALGPLKASEEPLAFHGLGDLGGGIFRSVAAGISADGTTICGHSSSTKSSTSTPNAEAFRWREGEQMVALGFFSLAQFYSIANAVSDDGSIAAGLAARPGVGPVNAALWIEDGGSTGIHNLGVLPGSSFGFSEGRGCSDDGLKVAGLSSSSSGIRAFLWVSDGGSSGVMKNLGVVETGTFSTASKANGISGDGQVVVGSNTLQDGMAGEDPEDPPTITRIATEAFRWDEEDGIEALGDLAGGPTGSEAFAASQDASVIVGYGTPADGASEGAIWNNGEIMSVGDLAGGAVNCRLLDLSADGSKVVGFSTDADGECAVIWDAERGLRKLSTALTELGLDLTGWSLTSAVGISADGAVITGNAINPSGDHEAWRLTGADALFTGPEPPVPAVTVNLGWGLQFSTEPGNLYQVEYSFNSIDWLPLGEIHSTVAAATASSHAVLDTTDPGEPKDYRVALLPGSISSPPSDLTRAQGAVISFQTEPEHLYQVERSELLDVWLDLGAPISTVGDAAAIDHSVFEAFQVFPNPIPATSSYRVNVTSP